MGEGNYSFLKVEGETMTAIGGAWTKFMRDSDPDSIESFGGALDAEVKDNPHLIQVSWPMSCMMNQQVNML